jgi:signal transduction histidine kinase
MIAPEDPSVDVPDLVARLAAHRTLASVPKAQLEWLASRARTRFLQAGEVVVRQGETVPDLWVLLSGHVSIRVNRGSGPRKAMEWKGGDVGGLLPYSRLSVAPGTSAAEEASEVVLVGKEHFPDLIRDCHELTATLVHVMLDRARHFTSSVLHDEKMLSLGRLAAGLAHELNNPASAVVRSAEALTTRLTESQHAFRALGAARLTGPETALIDRVIDACVVDFGALTASAIERADREDTFSDWLAAHGADTRAASVLAESAMTIGELDELAAHLDAATLGETVGALAAGCATRKLATEIERAASRIHGLVAAVKGFTYMDQAATPKPVDVARGLSDTLTVLHHKARTKSASVTLDAAPDIPRIQGFGGELNQVWANLVENALDAVPEGGRVVVRASVEGDSVVVRVIDNGPGIPPAIRDRIFDPFFTTKPVGSGTGLGLDIVRRLVAHHDGEIDVVSEPGRTEFAVTLPAGARASAG